MYVTLELPELPVWFQITPNSREGAEEYIFLVCIMYWGIGRNPMSYSACAKMLSYYIYNMSHTNPPPHPCHPSALHNRANCFWGIWGFLMRSVRPDKTACPRPLHTFLCSVQPQRMAACVKSILLMANLPCKTSVTDVQGSFVDKLMWKLFHEDRNCGKHNSKEVGEMLSRPGRIEGAIINIKKYLKSACKFMLKCLALLIAW